MLKPDSPLAPFVQNRKVVVLSQKNRAEQAAKAMRDQDIGSVVVADDDGHMTGVVTDRDLVCGVLAAELDPETPLYEIMSPELHGVKEDATLDDVIRVMIENGVRRVPILKEISDGRSRCLGMITLDDLIASKAIDTASLAKIVGTQTHSLRERPRRDPLRKHRRMEQTLSTFLKRVCEETGVVEADALEFSKSVLSLLVRRVTSREAAQFISQLPHLLQDDLLDQEAGPDRSITADRVISEIRGAVGNTLLDPYAVCRGFWRALASSVSPGELHDVYSQLPKDLQELFAGTPGGERREAAA